MTPPAPTPGRQPSDEAFALIAACRLAHFYDGLCAECVDAALATAHARGREEALEEAATGCENRAALCRQQSCEVNSAQYWAREGAFRAYMTDAAALRRPPHPEGGGA